MSDFTDALNPGPHPKTWFKYDFPLTANKPVPSTADYSEENVAPLIRSFATMLKDREPAELQLRYEANTSNVPDPQKEDDIIVGYAGDGVGKPCRDNLEGSKEMKRYNLRAKRSIPLKKFQDNSPAKINYFQTFDPCDAFPPSFFGL